MRRALVLVIRVSLVAASAVLALYLTYLRPAHMRWGATPVEVARRLPGDWIVRDASVSATRAVTIAAPPEQVWPWIVQMGTGRAGFYASDWLENRGVASATRLLPEFQSIRAGDIIPVPAGRRNGYLVKGFETCRYMLWLVRPSRVTWCWSLSPTPDGGTRLVARFRVRHRWLSPEIFRSLLAEARDAWTIKTCLLGIKERAERARSAR